MNFQYEKLIHNKIKSLALFIRSTETHFEYDEDALTQYTKGSIVFVDNSQLQFSEKYSDKGHRYRFQYMNKNKELIIRWDNSPHYPKIETFPHHKHIKNNLKPSKDINLIEVLDFIIEYILFNIEI